MDKRSEIAAVYVAGVIQGIALVTFPAAGTIFTSATHYAFSSTQYGGMFVPQAITAITAALLGAGWFDGSGKSASSSSGSALRPYHLWSSGSNLRRYRILNR